jgi:V8-like Glu-specific endopeptidase
MAGAFSVPGSLGAADPANPAVFQVLMVSKADGGFPSGGTAFFTASDGTALTNSHVVYTALSDPGHYQLVALYRGEFYSVDVVCASRLPERPSPDAPPSRIGRDVAEIRVRPWRTAGIATIQLRDGPLSSPVFTAHIVRLPLFPALRVGADAYPGMRIHVTGYGVRLGFRPWQQWTTAGVVTTLGTAADGAPVIGVRSMNAPRPGSSGSPILDEQDRVVGMIAWDSLSDLSFSAGIAGAALKEPCGQ